VDTMKIYLAEVIALAIYALVIWAIGDRAEKGMRV